MPRSPESTASASRFRHGTRRAFRRHRQPDRGGRQLPAAQGRDLAGRLLLFPKALEPGRFDAPVAVGGGLLDYKIELGFVALPAGGSDAPAMGLVLATDYTDRSILLERSTPSDPKTGIGFTDAKSRPGYMPVGNLFVVPHGVDAFYRTLVLKLYVNRELRQVAPPGEMVWDMAEIVGRSLKGEGRSWRWDGGTVPLAVEGGRVVPRTIILSGTLPHLFASAATRCSAVPPFWHDAG